jgi:polygalacturonase
LLTGQYRRPVSRIQPQFNALKSRFRAPFAFFCLTFHIRVRHTQSHIVICGGANVSDREIGSTLGHRWSSSVALLLLGFASCAALAASCTGSSDTGAAASTTVCSPLSFGAVGDGKTDNTTAIQNAVDACAVQTGGTVELSVDGKNAVYVTGPFTLKSHVHLQIDQGVTLQATNAHSRYVAAYINWVYQPNEALISAKGATDVAIIGPGIIDGAGNQPDPNDGGRTWYELRTAETAANPSTRPWVLEFYQCDHVTISGVTLQNQPYWTQALRFSSDITESGVTIKGYGPNSDGVDLVGATNVALSDLNISVGDDNIAIKSGLPISKSDPYYAKEIGLPQMPTSHVQITNITANMGGGVVIGSEAVNGVNNVTIDNVNFTNTEYGFRIKTARDRGGQIYGISVNHLVMTNVIWPLTIDAYYAPIGPNPRGPAQPITPTTPYVHDITVQDLVATDALYQSLIQGLPESCIHNVTLNGVSIQTRSQGIDLLHMTGTFTNVTSTPPPPDPPFVVEENVTVTTAGTTPVIPATPPLAGQVACSLQV